MARAATINVSLTPEQLRLVRQGVRSGRYESADEVIGEGLRMLFRSGARTPKPTAREFERTLASGYKVMAAHDRKLAREWAQLSDAWPEE